MRHYAISRRQFAFSGAALALASRLTAQQPITPHADVGALERDHILASAQRASGQPASADLDNLLRSSNTVAALMAAYVLTKDRVHLQQAQPHLVAWLASPKTPLLSLPPLADRSKIVDLAPLAELALAAVFLPQADDAADDFRIASRHCAQQMLSWLNTDPQAQLARDTKNHCASVWLLVAASCARLAANESELDRLRLQFKKPTLRNQIALDGRFPQELATENPLRNSLFNFDLLSGACQLLSSPFDDLWKFELPEGTGMRTAAAFLFPFLKDRSHWPEIADAEGFREVPLRRPGLLLAGRAYSQTEYVQLFAALPATQTPGSLQYSLPITQPLLWTARPPHGL